MWVIFVTIPGISPSAFGAFLRGSGQMAPRRPEAQECIKEEQQHDKEAGRRPSRG